MPCPSDTINVQLAGFISMAWNITSESTVLGLVGLVWSLLALSVGAAEYTDYISTEGQDTPNKCSEIWH